MKNKTLNIFGEIYKLKFITNLKDEKRKNIDGLFDGEKKIIAIEKKLKGDKRKIAIIHEIGHAVIFETFPVNLNDLIEEFAVDNIAKAVVKNMPI